MNENNIYYFSFAKFCIINLIPFINEKVFISYHDLFLFLEKVKLHQSLITHLSEASMYNINTYQTNIKRIKNVIPPKIHFMKKERRKERKKETKNKYKNLNLDISLF